MHEQRKTSSILDLLKFTFFALIIILPIRFFVAKPFIVQGASMEPNFHDGQYLIVDQLSYDFKNPQRGDVIVFDHHIVAGIDGAQDGEKYYIKRVIGLPGETIKGDRGKITIINAEHPQGIELNETYIVNRAEYDFVRRLENSEYFVMGDNRSASSDSRMWGPVKQNEIIGRPFLRLYPVNKLGIYPEEVADETK